MSGSLRWLFAALVVAGWLATPVRTDADAAPPADDSPAYGFAPSGDALPGQLTGRLRTAQAGHGGQTDYGSQGVGSPAHACRSASGRLLHPASSARLLASYEPYAKSLFDRVSYRTTGPPLRIG